MNNKILLCTDLDRTILPNGYQLESRDARPLLRRIAAHPELRLAYVSGRHKDLILEAIREYEIPLPDYSIGDVGTTLYEIGRDGSWVSSAAWEQEIGREWHGMKADQFAALFGGIDSLRLQEPGKQNNFKLSFYVPEKTDIGALRQEMSNRLAFKGLKANIITSIDEMNHIGLVDVLPENASKLHAIEFLIRKKGFSRARTVFAGDSGNDFEVLISGIQSVLVKNADDILRAEVSAVVRETGDSKSLYLATGGFFGLNGNYSGGVLEGLAHFLPETENWFTDGAAG